MTAVLIILVVIALVVGSVAAVALRQRRGFAAANELIPGRPTDAPAAWAGAHSPEARLHRRLIAAVAAMRACQEANDPTLLQSQAAVEQSATAIDRRLIAAAALPAGRREPAVAAAEPAVAALEDAVAAMSAAAVGPASEQASRQALDDAVRAAQMRMEALAAARVEVDRLDPGTTGQAT